VYELSRRYNIPVHLIAAWNDLNDISKIRAGQKLVFYVQNKENRVAGLSESQKSVKQITPFDKKRTNETENKPGKVQAELAAFRSDLHNEGSSGYYVVREGDSLWEIARQLNMDSKELKKVNSLATNVIHPGDRLQIAIQQSESEVSQSINSESVELQQVVAEFYYNVRRGDSLWTIAREYNVSTGEIKRWNNLNNNLIRPGNKLLLKVADAEESMIETFYQVRSGDSLWTIARRHNISPEKIKRWNNLQDNTIYPGNRLLLKLASGG